MGIARDVGIIDIYRYYDGAPYNGAYPIVVELKQRREKEQLLWRSKDRLRKIGIIVTDDTSLRKKQQEDEPDDDKQSKNRKPNATTSPKKKRKGPPAPEIDLFSDFF